MRVIIKISLLACMALPLASQSNNTFELGISFMKNTQSLLSVDYKYETWSTQILCSKNIIQGSVWNIHGLFQLQAGLSETQNQKITSAKDYGLEIGMQAGARIYWVHSQTNWRIYISGCTGPIYISQGIKRQSSGFNFASNFTAGINFSINRQFVLDLFTGFRHVSNLHIKLPNGGINSSLFGVGIIKKLGMDHLRT